MIQISFISLISAQDITTVFSKNYTILCSLVSPQKRFIYKLYTITECTVNINFKSVIIIIVFYLHYLTVTILPFSAAALKISSFLHPFCQVKKATRFDGKKAKMLSSLQAQKSIRRHRLRTPTVERKIRKLLIIYWLNPDFVYNRDRLQLTSASSSNLN